MSRSLKTNLELKGVSFQEIIDLGGTLLCYRFPPEARERVFAVRKLLAKAYLEPQPNGGLVAMWPGYMVSLDDVDELRVAGIDLHFISIDTVEECLARWRNGEPFLSEPFTIRGPARHLGVSVT